jgi:drug/metabolite transporter (DMT)-like permease
VASSAGTETEAPGPPTAAVASRAWLGPFCAITGVLGFSFKAVLVKLAYAAAPVDPTTLLTLRMLYSAPLFGAMAWYAGRTPDARPMEGQDWLALAGLGFVGYYLASLLDFIGLQYITASLERLILFVYPTIVVVLSAVFLRRPVTLRAIGALLLCYAGIALAFWHDLEVGGDARATTVGAALVFASAFAYAIYLVAAGRSIARLGSLRFVAWAMLMSTLFIVVQFALTRPLGALAAPRPVHLLTIAMALLSTVLPTWLVAESIRRMGANTASLIGSLGPVFTIGLGAWLLAEPVHAVQLIGAALVLAGVALVTFRVRDAAATRR